MRQLLILIAFLILGCNESVNFTHDSKSILGKWKLSELRYNGAVLDCSSQSKYTREVLPILFDVEFTETKCIYTEKCFINTVNLACGCTIIRQAGATAEYDWMISSSRLSTAEIIVDGGLAGNSIVGDISAKNMDELIFSIGNPIEEIIYTFKR